MTEKKAKTAREALLMAADLLSKRGAWCRGYFALDAQGASVSPDSSEAVKFCAWGAIQAVATGRIEYRAVRRFEQFVGRQIGIWNNSKQSKRPVIAALRKAAEL